MWCHIRCISLLAMDCFAYIAAAAVCFKTVNPGSLFSPTQPSGPSWSSSRNVCVFFVCLSPSHAIFSEASHWPSICNVQLFEAISRHFQQFQIIPSNMLSFHHSMITSSHNQLSIETRLNKQYASQISNYDPLEWMAYYQLIRKIFFLHVRDDFN